MFHDNSRRLSSWQFALITALSLLLNFFELGSNRALTKHEMLVAGAAKEAVMHGHWIVPHIGDQPWLEKPPLPIWMAAFSAFVLGWFDEFTVRLPFAIAGLAVTLLVAQLMTILFGRRVGFLAGIVQGTSVYQVMYARLVEADVLLQALVLAAITVFATAERLRRESGTLSSSSRLGFWILLGLTNLVKGVGFGAVLTALTCFGWLAQRRDWSGLRHWLSPVGIGLALLITIPWPVAVALLHPDVLELWNEHSLGRAAGSLGYQQPWWYYLTTWPWQLLPWTAFFAVGAKGSWDEARRDPASADRFIWWWALSQGLLLSLSSGKHHHYLIYALPALTPIAVQGLLKGATAINDVRFDWHRAAKGLTIVGLSSLAASAAALFVRARGIDVLSLGLLIGLALLLIGFTLRRRMPASTLAVFLTAVVFGHLYAQGSIMPRVDPRLADKRFLTQVDERLPSDTRLVVCGGEEIARHTFYLHHPSIGIWNAADLPPALSPSGATYLVAPRSLEPALSHLGRVTLLLRSEKASSRTSPTDPFGLFRIDTVSQNPASGARL